jgi:hypothetical protein
MTAIAISLAMSARPDTHSLPLGLVRNGPPGQYEPEIGNDPGNAGLRRSTERRQRGVNDAIIVAQAK